MRKNFSSQNDEMRCSAGKKGSFFILESFGASIRIRALQPASEKEKASDGAAAISAYPSNKSYTDPICSNLNDDMRKKREYIFRR